VVTLMQGSRCLFEPLSLGGITLANRIAVSPMCQYSAENGAANDWHLQHLGSLSLSGAALVIVEQTAVEPAGGISHGCLGLYSDANERTLARVVGFCPSAGSAALGIQLAHAGRKGSAGLPWEGGGPLARDAGAWTTAAPPAIPFDDHWPPPQALDEIGWRVFARLTQTPPGAPTGSALISSNCSPPTAFCRTAFCRRSPTDASISCGGSLANRRR
jgi:2,4-dienoyl-CoA reductase-like NADH-dependent reductase (Old Yellow Enzyme family)